jgi:hypothetical protein
MDTTSYKKFNFASMCKNPHICIIGKRSSGKTSIILDILSYLYETKKIDECVIISPTNKYTHQYDCITQNTFYEYNEKNIVELMNKQKERLVKKISTTVALVFDDCLPSKNDWIKSSLMNELFLNSRYYNIVFIFTMQFPLGISPDIRSNFDYIFLLEEDFISNIKRSYDHYARLFPSFDSFRDTFSELTKNYGALVITQQTNILDKIFFYRASEIKSKINIPMTYLENDEPAKGINNLLTSIASCNEKICNYIMSNDLNENKLKIFQSIVDNNNLILSKF